MDVLRQPAVPSLPRLRVPPRAAYPGPSPVPPGFVPFQKTLVSCRARCPQPSRELQLQARLRPSDTIWTLSKRGVSNSTQKKKKKSKHR